MRPAVDRLSFCRVDRSEIGIYGPEWQLSSTCFDPHRSPFRSPFIVVVRGSEGLASPLAEPLTQRGRRFKWIHHFSSNLSILSLTLA